MSEPARRAERERLIDLSCDQATQGLSAEERAEFESLCRAFPDANDGSFDRVAAMADLAMSGRRSEPMPSQLRTKIIADGQRLAAERRPSLSIADAAGSARSPAPRRVGRSDSMRFAGWLAAAAAVVVAAIGWMRTPNGSGATPLPTRASSPAAERDLLLAAADAVVIPMNDWDNPEQGGVRGDVVWSESEQAGYLRLAGLKVNDPSIEQYQLWIIDSRGMEQRISGALFDAQPDPVTGEVIVEIDPQIATKGAAAFALTIEKPGGVWVSDMTRRVVIGAKG